MAGNSGFRDVSGSSWPASKAAVLRWRFMRRQVRESRILSPLRMGVARTETGCVTATFDSVLLLSASAEATASSTDNERLGLLDSLAIILQTVFGDESIVVAEAVTDPSMFISSFFQSVSRTSQSALRNLCLPARSIRVSIHNDDAYEFSFPVRNYVWERAYKKTSPSHFFIFL